jgi:hypothetical protein
MKRILPLIIIIACMACIVPLQRHYANNLAGPENDDRIFKVPADTRVTMAFSFGYDCIWVDLFWYRMVQYFGGNYSTLSKDWKKEGYLNLAENIVTLDPNFYRAYDFISFTVMEGCRDFDVAVDYQRRCAEQFPQDWKCRWMLGWNLTFVNSDVTPKEKQEAIDVLTTATEIPGCEGYVARYLAQILADEKLWIKAERIPFEKLKKAQEDGDEANAALYEKQLYKIRANWIRDNLDKCLQQYQAEKGRNPEKISDLIGTATRILPLGESQYRVARLDSILPDPRGGEFLYCPVVPSITTTVEIEERWRLQIDFLESKVKVYIDGIKQVPTDWEVIMKGWKPEEKEEMYKNVLSDPFGGRYILHPDHPGKVFHEMKEDWWVDQLGPDRIYIPTKP